MRIKPRKPGRENDKEHTVTEVKSRKEFPKNYMAYSGTVDEAIFSINQKEERLFKSGYRAVRPLKIYRFVYVGSLKGRKNDEDRAEIAIELEVMDGD